MNARDSIVDHRTVETPLRMRICGVQTADCSTPGHVHECASLFIVNGGELDDAHEGRLYTLRAGDVLFHPAGSRHSIITRRRPFHAIVVDIPGDVLQQFCSMYGNRSGSVITSAVALAGLPHRLAAEWSHDDSAAPFALEALVLQILAEGSRIRMSLRDQRPQWVRSALEYVERTTHHPVTSKEVAERFALTEREVREGFRRYVGRRVAEVSMAVRIKVASERLEGDAPISDIAAEFGFYDQSHLTKVFRRVNSLTPNQWRAIQKSRLEASRD